MATTTSVTTTYAGEFAGKYISAALLSADTLEGGGITIKPNVKFKEVLKTINLDAITKDATCDFSDTSTLTLAESILAVKELQVNLELCKKDFSDDWHAIEMGLTAHDSLPASFSDYLIGYVAAKVAAKNETNIWQGADSNEGEFDGFTTLAAANSDVVDVTGTTITASNVIDELGKVVDAIPSPLYGKEDLFVYVSSHIARSYVRALGGFGANGLGANGVNNAGTTWYNGGDLAFDGVKLFVASGLPTNDMIAAQKSNLFFGTSLLADWQEVKLLDMADLDGSKNVRVIMRMAAGCQIGIGADVVYYT
tara:strand:+ start:1437 stop:2363 length:927 start_codon:yes stop_codon:yes gene_type:complete